MGNLLSGGGFFGIDKPGLNSCLKQSKASFEPSFGKAFRHSILGNTYPFLEYNFFYFFPKMMFNFKGLKVYLKACSNEAQVYL